MHNSEKPLREWQREALSSWRAHKRRGIAAVVTGGGKTFFALHCLRDFQHSIPAATALIVVPTEALLDQWLEEIVSFFGLPLKRIAVLNNKSRFSLSRIHIGVINTVAQLAESRVTPPLMLVVDECHKAASPVFRSIFKVTTEASLGLSATPERPYDPGFEDILLPALGPVICRYDYRHALRDGVIVPFVLHNIVFEFTAEEQKSYDTCTRKIHAAIKKYGVDSPEAVALLLKRARLSNASESRVKIALRLVGAHRKHRILIFHEDISSCEAIHRALAHFGIASGIYHSAMSTARRVQTLADYRAGKLQVLVSCRALDEGFNVPETEIGIIAASTATHRQRVQRLGRVLRPCYGKTTAIVYSIVAAPMEIRRLAQEAESLEDIVEVKWSKA